MGNYFRVTMDAYLLACKLFDQNMNQDIVL